MKLPPLWDPALDAHVPETRAFNAKLPKEETPARWTPEAIARARDLSQIMGGVFATKAIAGFEDRTIAGPAGPLRRPCWLAPRLPWCERRDSNPHALRRQNLNLVRLPIPPLSRLSDCNIIVCASKAGNRSQRCDAAS